MDEKSKKSVFKKWWFWVIVAVVLIIIIAAVSGGGSNNATTANSQANQAVAITETVSPAASASAMQSASANTGSGTIGNYQVTITGCKLSKDSDGKPAAIITYKWTNNSDKAASFMTALISKVFQNGIECDTALIFDDKSYNSGDQMKEIKPGASLTVQGAFALQDTKNPVQVEVSEFLSLSSNPPTVTRTFNIAK